MEDVNQCIKSMPKRKENERQLRNYVKSTTHSAAHLNRPRIMINNQ